MHHQVAYIVYYITASISGLCSVFVATTLCRLGSLKTAATKLLLMLHVTLLIEEVSSIPYAFNSNQSLCTTVSFFHFYSGLSNVVATGLLVVSYRYLFIEDTHEIMEIITKYAIHIVAGFPLITLLPFITNSYANDNDVWCTMRTEAGLSRYWAFGVFYSWVWLILALSALTLMLTMYQVYSVDEVSGINLFSTTGMYSIISILSWVPRTAIRFSFVGHQTNDVFLYAYFPVFLAGIGYTLVFLREKKALLLFDRLSDWNGDNASVDHADNVEVARTSFSWETGSQRSDRELRRSTSSGTAYQERFAPKRGVYSALIPEQFLLED